MKTKNIIIAIMAIFSWANLFAQEANEYNNKTFLKEGRVWNCHRFYDNNGDRYTDYTDYYSYVLQGDTVIENNTYHKVVKKSKAEYGDDSLHYYAAVREDNDIIYFVNNEETEERILYDFDVKKGDEWVFGEHSFQALMPFPNFTDDKYHSFVLASERVKILQESDNSIIADLLLIPYVGIMSADLLDPFNVDDWFNQFKPQGLSETYPFYSKGVLDTCKDENICIYDNNSIIHYLFDGMPVPDAIELIETISKNSNAIYDLSGRKVNTLHLSPGIYIKNGKKFWAK